MRNKELQFIALLFISCKRTGRSGIDSWHMSPFQGNHCLVISWQTTNKTSHSMYEWMGGRGGERSEKPSDIPMTLYEPPRISFLSPPSMVLCPEEDSVNLSEITCSKLAKRISVFQHSINTSQPGRGQDFADGKWIKVQEIKTERNDRELVGLWLNKALLPVELTWWTKCQGTSTCR